MLIRPVTQPRPRRVSGFIELFAGLRWAIAATPVVIAAILFARSEFRPAGTTDKTKSADAPGIKANALQVDHSLVSTFDAVAELPGGQPVRYAGGHLASRGQPGPDLAGGQRCGGRWRSAQGWPSRPR